MPNRLIWISLLKVSLFYNTMVSLQILNDVPLFKSYTRTQLDRLQVNFIKPRLFREFSIKFFLKQRIVNEYEFKDFDNTVYNYSGPIFNNQYDADLIVFRNSSLSSKNGDEYQVLGIVYYPDGSSINFQFEETYMVIVPFPSPANFIILLFIVSVMIVIYFKRIIKLFKGWLILVIVISGLVGANILILFGLLTIMAIQQIEKRYSNILNRVY